MRPKPLPLVALLVLLLTTLFPPLPTLAAEEVVEDEYEEQARVMRVSHLRGEATLRRAGQLEWEQARLNVPVAEGDSLATGADARLELQLDARNFIRIGPDSVLRVVTLRDEGVAFSVSEGTATFRLARFDRDREYFEIDAPGTTVAAEKLGLYRVDVGRRGEVSITVRDDGRARVYSQTSGFVLRNNRSARLVVDDSGEGDWELSAAGAFDFWDSWNGLRERELAERLRQKDRDRYYDPEVWGAEELDAYGEWLHTREYGYVWRPHGNVIGSYHDWAPYRYGHWRYCPPYGWTWIPDEEWGWAPYHYGRWVYVGGNWCWAPRGYGYRYRRAWWRPALVAFILIPTAHGEQVCWYPLRHGQRDPRGRHWPRGYDRLSPLNRRELENLRRANPALLRAVTSVPAREFGSESMRARPAPAEIAQRALTDEPVRGRLPILPGARPGLPAQGTERARVPDAQGERPRGLVVARPAPLGRELSDRQTGAAARTPGVALGGELRRARVFGDREPRVTAPPSDTQGVPADAGTGAVTRRPRTSRRPVEGGGRLDNPVVVAPDPRGDDPSAPPRARPVRPSRPGIGDGEDSGVERVPRRTRPGRDEGDNDGPAPRVRAREDQPPPPVYQPEPHARPSEPAERPRHDPPPRHEQPRQEAPRQERSEPRQERPAAPARTAPRTRVQDQR